MTSKVKEVICPHPRQEQEVCNRQFWAKNKNAVDKAKALVEGAKTQALMEVYAQVDQADHLAETEEFRLLKVLLRSMMKTTCR